MRYTRDVAPVARRRGTRRSSPALAYRGRRAVQCARPRGRRDELPAPRTLDISSAPLGRPEEFLRSADSHADSGRLLADFARCRGTSTQHIKAVRRDTPQALRLCDVAGGARPGCGMGGVGPHEQSPKTRRFAGRAKLEGRLGWETYEAFSHDDRLGR